MKHLLLGMLVILMAMFLIAGCARAVEPTRVEEEEEEVGEGGGTLTTAIPVKPTQIDPQATPNAGLDAILPYLFDTLVVRGANGDLVPSLAESWKLDSDGQAVTMTLRASVFFHDGNPLNAQAVKFTFDRFKASGRGSPLYDRIMGIAEIQVLDALTVRFTLGGPIADFWDAVTSPYAGILSPQSAELAERTGSGEMIGSGPFMRVDSENDHTIALTRYVGYHWGPAVTQNHDATFIENIVFDVIPDSDAQVAAIEKGQLGAIYVTRADQWLKLERDSSVQLIRAGQAETQGVAVARQISGVKIGGLGQMLLNDARIQDAPDAK